MNKRGQRLSIETVIFLILAAGLLIFGVFFIYNYLVKGGTEKVEDIQKGVPLDDSLYSIKKMFGGLQKERLEDFDSVLEDNICIVGEGSIEGDNQETLRIKRSNLVDLFDELDKIKDEEEKEKRSIKLEAEIKRCDALENQLKEGSDST